MINENYNSSCKKVVAPNGNGSYLVASWTNYSGE